MTVLALESPDEIPADPEEIEEAEREGITILYRRGPHRFVGDDRITGLETIDVESVFDADGRFAPSFRPGTKQVVPASTVILAVGQAADLGFLGDVELDTAPNGTVRVDPESLRTSHPNVWAGGDVAHGPRNLIDAIADGRRGRARSTRCSGAGTRPPAVVGGDRAHGASGFPARRQRVRRHRTGAGADHAHGRRDRLRGGGDRLRRRRRDAGGAPLPALLRQRDARTESLHPLRTLCRRVPDELHQHRARRPHRCGANNSRCCCSTRTAASAVPSASSGARRSALTMATPGRSCGDRQPCHDALDRKPHHHPARAGASQRSEVWRSAFRHPQLDTARGRALQSFSNFFLHVYPVKVPARVLRLRYSFRLGFIAAVLFAILLVTGVYLMFVYTPSPTAAYGDMQHLKTGVGFGQLIRNVHRWSAHLMVLVVILHLVRVFYAGAYKRPRQFNWVLGVVLLLITLGSLVHGLPAALGSVELLGGDGGDEPRPLRPGRRRHAAEPAHRRRSGGCEHAAAVLRAARRGAAGESLVLVLGVHIWRVRKDGFAVPRPDPAATTATGDAHTCAAGSAERVVRRPRADARCGRS